MRRYYIDNIRSLCVLILFPHHTFMIYNTFGESFYIKGADIQSLSFIITAIWPWIMPLMFLIAGVSTAYSLQKRTKREYIAERLNRLLVPTIFGILLLVPIQTFFAEKFHNSYTGNYFEQYVLFFTKDTDLSGYHGGFTPAHLWYLIYLFVISMVALLIIYLSQKSGIRLVVKKIPFVVLLSFFIIPAVSQVILDLDGKSLGEYLAWFLLGYFVLSNDDVVEKVTKYRFLTLSIGVVLLVSYTFFGVALEEYNWVLFEVLYGLYAWVAILSIIGFGKRYLSGANRLSKYLSKHSFGIYFLHQQWIVVTAYFALMWFENIVIQIVSVLLSSIVLTFFSDLILSRIPFIRYIFGIKDKSKEIANQ